MFTPMRLVGTACGGLLPSSAKADATSLMEGGSAHADAAMQNRFFDKLKRRLVRPSLFCALMRRAVNKLNSAFRIPHSEFGNRKLN